MLLLLCSCKESQPIVKNLSSTNSRIFIKTFHEGLRLKLKGDYLEAIERFKECLEKEPTDDAAHFALAQTYLQIGDLQSAEIHTVSAVEYDRDNIFYQVELAYMLREKGAYMESGELFELITEARPRSVEYYMAAISCYKMNKSNLKAISVLEKLEDTKGASLETSLRKHQLYFELGKNKEAEKILLALYKRDQKNPVVIASLVDYFFRTKQELKAYEKLEELVVVDPLNGLGFLMLAENEYEKGNTDKTAAYFYKAIETENIGTTETLGAFEYLVYAKDSVKVKQSISIMKQSFSSNDTVFAAIGDYYMKSRRIDDLVLGVEYYTNAVEFNPNRYDIWQKLLYVYYDSKSWIQLKEASDKTVRLFPLNPEPYYLGSVAYNQLRSFQNAEQFVRQGLMAVVENPILKSDLLGQLGEAFFGMGNLDEGLNSYMQAIQIKEKTTQGYLRFNLALRLYEKKFKLGKALEIIDLLIMNSQQKEANVMVLKSDILFELERFDEVLLVLAEISIDNQKFKAGILERKGDVFAKQLKYVDAICHWKESKKLGGDGKDLLEKIKTGRYVE